MTTHERPIRAIRAAKGRGEASRDFPTIGVGVILRQGGRERRCDFDGGRDPFVVFISGAGRHGERGTMDSSRTLTTTERIFCATVALNGGRRLSASAGTKGTQVS